MGIFDETPFPERETFTLNSKDILCEHIFWIIHKHIISFNFYLRTSFCKIFSHKNNTLQQHTKWR